MKWRGREDGREQCVCFHLLNFHLLYNLVPSRGTYSSSRRIQPTSAPRLVVCPPRGARPWVQEPDEGLQGEGMEECDSRSSLPIKAPPV